MVKKISLRSAAKDWTPELRRIVDSYADDPHHHAMVWTEFYENVNQHPSLRRHRDFVEKHSYGFGDRPFHYLWKLLVDQMPDDFSFLEIGVYKGQVLSLIQLLALEDDRKSKVYGVTPLTSAGDKYSLYPESDYGSLIRGIFQEFELPLANLHLIGGLSTEDDVKAQVSACAPFDIIYVDGCHEYDAVVHDIKMYGPLVRSGGFLVIDDAAQFLHLPDSYAVPATLDSKSNSPESRPRYEPAFNGHEDVSRAVRNHLDDNPEYLHLFACGHNRVWLRG